MNIKDRCLYYEMSTYKTFHQNTINKMLHVFCIPIIMVTTLNFFSYLNIRLSNNKGNKLGSKIIHGFDEYNFDKIIALLFPVYYFINYSLEIGIYMSIFILFLYKFAKIWRNNDIQWLKRSIIYFVAAWVIQFIGHAFEGNRPAFLTSVKMSIFEAPLYTLNYMVSFSNDI